MEIAPRFAGLSTSAGHSIAVYDLDVCETLRAIPFDTGFSALAFADDTFLWALDWENGLHIIELNQDPSRLLESARALAERSRQTNE